MPALRLTADWLVPVIAPPIPGGAILIGEDGRVQAAGAAAEVPHPRGVPELRFVNAVLMPGLVNVHTHLELTGMAGRAEEQDFVAWIGTIRRLKGERTPPDFVAAAREGLRACWAAGVTTVADTGDSGAALVALAEMGGSGIAYQEVFGPHPDQLRDELATLRARVDARVQLQTPRALLGVSPHAPYTVSGALYRATAELARSAGLPIAVHIAESAAESALLADGTGGFGDAWRRRGIPLPEAGRTPVGWLAEHGVLSPRTLCIHAVRLSASDIELLRSSGAAVAHCPSSNRRHGHGDAPVRALLDAGIPVGVGTDSEASVGPLDLLAEARIARELGSLGAREALGLATAGAAAALGLADEVGSLLPGRWGDVTAIALPPGLPRDVAASVEEAVLASGPADVVGTWIGGRRAWAAPGVTTR
jgi:5-methylthioadenosine/S-adenosylhomocysteine deaminase